MFMEWFFSAERSYVCIACAYIIRRIGNTGRAAVQQE